MLVQCMYFIIPFKSKELNTDLAIMAANKTPIRCWGWRNQTICASGQNFKWTFLLADVGFPILGADFLDRYDILVNLR